MTEGGAWSRSVPARTAAARMRIKTKARRTEVKNRQTRPSTSSSQRRPEGRARPADGGAASASAPSTALTPCVSIPLLLHVTPVEELVDPDHVVRQHQHADTHH